MVREANALPWRSGSQLSITRRPATTQAPSAKPSRALAATQCHSAEAVAIQSKASTAETPPTVIIRRSQPRSAKDASHRWATRVNTNDTPAIIPRDQVGNPKRSWMSASSEMITPIPIACAPMNRYSTMRGNR